MDTKREIVEAQRLSARHSLLIDEAEAEPGEVALVALSGAQYVAVRMPLALFRTDDKHVRAVVNEMRRSLLEQLS